jgi:hypothetical protein
VDVGGIELRRAVRGEPAEDLVRDAVTLVFAGEHRRRDLRPLGVLRVQVSEQGRCALHVASGFVEELEELDILLRLRGPHERTVGGGDAADASRSQAFHDRFTLP